MVEVSLEVEVDVTSIVFFESSDFTVSSESSLIVKVKGPTVLGMYLSVSSCKTGAATARALKASTRA